MCGLASITLSICFLPSQDLGNGDEQCTAVAETVIPSPAARGGCSIPLLPNYVGHLL